jgi:hypothetical protein
LAQIKVYLGKCTEILDDYPDNGETADQLDVYMGHIRSIEAKEAAEAAKLAEEEDYDKEEEEVEYDAIN